MRQGPTRSIIAAKTGSDCFRWRTACRIGDVDSPRTQRDTEKYRAAVSHPRTPKPGVLGNPILAAVRRFSPARTAGVGLAALHDADFRVRTVHLLQRVANLAHSGIGADGIDDIRHRVSVGDFALGAYLRLLRCSFRQGVEAALDFFVGALRTQLL